MVSLQSVRPPGLLDGCRSKSQLSVVSLPRFEPTGVGTTKTVQSWLGVAGRARAATAASARPAIRVGHSTLFQGHSAEFYPRSAG